MNKPIDWISVLCVIVLGATLGSLLVAQNKATDVCSIRVYNKTDEFTGIGQFRAYDATDLVFEIPEGWSLYFDYSSSEGQATMLRLVRNSDTAKQESN